MHLCVAPHRSELAGPALPHSTPYHPYHPYQHSRVPSTPYQPDITTLESLCAVPPYRRVPLRCWSKDPGERPSADMLMECIDLMIQDRRQPQQLDDDGAS